jgi:sec-independent protein translocase protein TatC
MSDDDDKKMTLLEHLDELRLRILYSLLAWVICSIGAYFFTPAILRLFTSMINTKLVFVNPTEALFAYLKIAMFVGFFVSLPIVLYQVLFFIIPGLKKDERKWVLRLVPFAVLLFFTGVLFAYFVLIPVSLRFFLSFGTSDLVPMITIGGFISFVLTLLIICGVTFQTPMIILFLGLIGLVDSRILAEKRKYVIVFFFVLAAIATPTPDAFTQIIVTIPLLFLYEVSILLLRIIEKRRPNRALLL